MSYGLPYKGSKNRIAKWVVSNLPANDTLVDIFAGGCAVTHCAMLSGKFRRVIANDIGDGPEIFWKALRGEIDTSDFPLTREEFKKTTDTLSRLIYSYGNNTLDYTYSKKCEDVCVAAERVIYGKTIEERYSAYREFFRVLERYLSSGNKVDRNISELRSIQNAIRLPGIERYNRVRDIKGAGRSTTFENVNVDYRSLNVPDKSTVYADPPYRGTRTNQYKFDFDYGAFEGWLASVDFPVFVSEYTCPKGCVEVARRETVSLAGHSNRTRVVERIFVQERFYDAVAGGGDDD